MVMIGFMLVDGAVMLVESDSEGDAALKPIDDGVTLGEISATEVVSEALVCCSIEATPSSSL